MVYPISGFFLGNIIKLYIRKIEGLENIPKEPFIIASNHASYVDALFIPYVIIRLLNKKIRVFVNSRYYKNFFLRKFLYHFGCIPVDIKKYVPNDEERKKTNKLAFKIAKEGLKKGEIFGIFPEGTRSQDGKLKKAKKGMARMVLEANVPVVPMGSIGSYEIMPKGTIFPRFRKATIRIGKPIYFKNKDLDEITTTIMKEIAKLANQEY